MPLLILGAIVIIGILAYWYFGGERDDESQDTRPVRERYSHAFDSKKNIAKDAVKDVTDEVTKVMRKSAGIYDVDYEVQEDMEGGDNTIPFPSKEEREKFRRDID